MEKRIPALLSAVALLVTLCACGDQPPVSDPSGESGISSAPYTDTADSDSQITSATETASDVPTSAALTAGGTTRGTTTRKKTTATAATASAGQTVAFADLDLNNMAGLREAPGADSGKNGTVYVINIASVRSHCPNLPTYYDQLKLIASLQGLENRGGQQKIYVDDGSDWFTFFRATTDGLLYGKKRVEIKTIDAFLKTFEKEIKSHGIVVWDPAQPFTSNIATNVCGVEGYLPVMYSDDEDSLYARLTGQCGTAVVKMDLRGKFTGKKGSKIWDTALTSTGSAKCDAYLWAMEKYVKTGKTSKEYIAYMVDYYPLTPKGTGYLDTFEFESYLPSQDFVVQNAIFTFDLAPWENEAATDDPTQPVGEDYRTFCKLLRYQYDRNKGAFSQCIGFPGFVYKYTDRVGGKHGDTEAEWETVELLSAYNIVMQGDCPGPSSLYNCSVYSQYRRQVTYSQAAKRQKALANLPAYEDNTTYAYIYMGDYDAVSWTYYIAANRLWRTGRGEVPLAWAFNPNLMDRIPMVWDYFYATATDQDYFIGGDSGAGYINSALLIGGERQHSDLPDGLSQWVDWCKKWYKIADLSITGMLLNGNNPYAGAAELTACQQFSPDGIGLWNWPNNDSSTRNFNGTGVSGMSQYWYIDQNGTAAQGADALIEIIDSRRSPRFYSIKCCVCSPKLVAESVKLAQQKLAAEGKGRKLKVVDPYTYFAMIAKKKAK